jgi:hypothetical protein
LHYLKAQSRSPCSLLSRSIDSLSAHASFRSFPVSQTRMLLPKFVFYLVSRNDVFPLHSPPSGRSPLFCNYSTTSHAHHPLASHYNFKNMHLRCYPGPDTYRLKRKVRGTMSRNRLFERSQWDPRLHRRTPLYLSSPTSHNDGPIANLFPDRGDTGILYYLGCLREIHCTCFFFDESPTATGSMEKKCWRRMVSPEWQQEP